MKKIVKLLLMTSITLASSTLISPSIVVAENKTITISTGEWPPFLSEKMKYHGVAARIISESFAQQNIQVSYGWFPWKRSYNNVKNGSWDASAIWAITEDRSKELLFSDPVIENKTVLFFRKDSYIDWKSYEDLSGIVIGGTNGYFNGMEFDKAEKSGLITVDRTSTESHNFKKLAANRIDAVVAEIDTGYEIMHRLLKPEQIESIIVSPQKIASFSNHLVISKKIKNGEELLSTFNKGLKQLTESGKVDQYIMESRNGLYNQESE